MMFALNEGYQWFSTNFTNLEGVVYLAAGNDAERMRRSPQANFTWKLFDPQLYLAGLAGGESAKICARLASYPWFGIDGVPEFNSGEQTRRDWQQALQDFVRDNWRGNVPEEDARSACAASAVSFQADLGCTHILAPTPLISEREDEAESCALWVDAALDAAAELDIGQPVIATVAVSEGVLNDASFNEGGFLDTIVDQVASRNGLGGVYVVVAQTQSRHPLSLLSIVTRTYAHLTRAFANAGYEFIFVNFADVFGIACLGLGATGFATGRLQSLRRLCLAAMLDDGGGLPLPHLYTHRAVAEFLTEREMEVVAQRNLLPRVRDLTTYSQDLFQALNTGQDISTIPAWAESKNNVITAAKHFIARMIAEGAAYSDLATDERHARATAWLASARTHQEALINGLANQLVTSPTYAPVIDWSDHIANYFE
jgi:hypothetical protein